MRKPRIQLSQRSHIHDQVSVVPSPRDETGPLGPESLQIDLAEFAALGTQEAALGSIVELIFALAQEQERDNKGIRSDKLQFTDLLTDATMAVAGPVGAWAMVTMNERVRQQVELQPSFLKKQAAERLLFMAKDVLSVGETYLAETADYALSESVLDVLRSRIVAFEQLVVAPREGVARTATLTILVEKEVERGMTLLRLFFDRIMFRFKESDAEFFTNYQQARKVIRPSVPLPRRGGRRWGRRQGEAWRGDGAGFHSGADRGERIRGSHRGRSARGVRVSGAERGNRQARRASGSGD